MVEALTALLGEMEGAPEALDGGITNRNYRARLGGADYVIRVPGKDTGLLEIDRTAERVANERAAEQGIAPAVAAFLDDPPCIVTAFVEGDGISAEELRRPEALASTARALRSFHESGATLPVSFSGFRIAERYAQTSRRRGAAAPEDLDWALGIAGRIEAALSHPDHDPVPCHNDLLAGNFIRGPEQVWIVDWEYAGMGDRFFDLANFAVNNELDNQACATLVHLYFGEQSPGSADEERRLAALRLFRFMSDFREAMWGVVQSVLSDLDFDFAAYGAKHFARMRSQAADPRFDVAMERCARAA